MGAPVDLLRGLPFFRGLTPEAFEAVAGACRDERHEAGALVCREGTEADRFFIVVDGTVEVWKDWGAREADLLALHGPGHLFGEMALVDELPRSATVVAREAVRLLAIGRDDFHRIVRENASVALSVMRSISSMVRASNESFVEGLRRRNRALQEANSALRETQSRLLRAERLSVVGRFSSLILHDIRNPLSVLRTYAEMALVRMDDAAVVQRNLSRIIDEADRLGRIAAELLDYTRGEIRLSMSIVEPRQLVEKAVQVVSGRFAARGIEVRTEVGETGPAILDFDRMLRVLLNLADNSRKAMSRGGVFTLKVARESDRLVFEVADTGEGMDPQVQENLFEPFFSSSREGGTGLGMTIVKNVVDAHEGQLSFTSRRGEGTTFRISLPARG